MQIISIRLLTILNDVTPFPAFLIKCSAGTFPAPAALGKNLSHLFLLHIKRKHSVSPMLCIRHIVRHNKKTIVLRKERMIDKFSRLPHDRVQRPIIGKVERPIEAEFACHITFGEHIPSVPPKKDIRKG